MPLAGIRRRDARAVAVGVVGGVAIATVLWVWGASLLRLFGPGFETARLPLALLTGAYCINTLAGTSGYLLIMSRHAAATAVLFSAATLIAVVMHLLLIPRWGSVGAAAGTAVALCVLTLGLRIGAARVLAGKAGPNP
jgi:O-antigen/teichoic acid export membrane protein